MPGPPEGQSLSSRMRASITRRTTWRMRSAFPSSNHCVCSPSIVAMIVDAASETARSSAGRPTAFREERLQLRSMTREDELTMGGYVDPPPRELSKVGGERNGSGDQGAEQRHRAK